MNSVTWGLIAPVLAVVIGLQIFGCDTGNQLETDKACVTNNTVLTVAEFKEICQ